jgi:protein gp37
MSENTGISWAHNTQNFWVGCDKVAPECAHCYIDRVIRKQKEDGVFREPWGKVYRTKTWGEPIKWQVRAAGKHMLRVFTCSLSDFFHKDADPWRDEAWEIIRHTPNLVWLVLTKRPSLIESRLPSGWPFPNVWLGVSTGSVGTLNKMDVLRKIPIHEKAVRWISAEPLLEDIAPAINLDGFGWVVTGGESGSGTEYMWNATYPMTHDWKRGGRRTMLLEWAMTLRDKTKEAGLPFMFKQVTAPSSGTGVNALGRDLHEFPEPHLSLPWAPRQEIAAKNLYTIEQLGSLNAAGQLPKKNRHRRLGIGLPEPSVTTVEGSSRDFRRRVSFRITCRRPLHL